LFSGFLEVLVLIAGVGLGGITVVVGLGAAIGALVRRRIDARVMADSPASAGSCVPATGRLRTPGRT
jgi:hypothetical protein